jgi:indole-3-pyruvate monooxygenase
MKETKTVIVGASISGLASASSLKRQGIEYTVIEKQGLAGAPWHHHYDRLHLHTPKSLSNLPYKKFDTDVPRYPSRQQVTDYLSDYQKAFDINPIYNTEAKSIRKEGDFWITETTNGAFKSKYVIVATGSYGKAKAVNFKGMETFGGEIVHSCNYKTGQDFKGQKVLVVGFGNSACEIAIDLYEQGAVPSMSVRSPVNVIPRDVMGIPILKLSLLMSQLPPRLADAVNDPLMRLIFGDITKLGLKKMSYGAFQQINKDGSIPLLDIGTIKHIKQGHIKIFDNIKYITKRSVYFVDGTEADFDTIVAAIGYNPDIEALVDLDKTRLEDLKIKTSKQKYFGKDNLYFCGFYISPTGAIREISIDAQKIAKDITKKENLRRL